MKKRIQVYISPEANALLREKAQADKRSISATVELLIIKDREAEIRPRSGTYRPPSRQEIYRISPRDEVK